MRGLLILSWLLLIIGYRAERSNQHQQKHRTSDKIRKSDWYLNIENEEKEVHHIPVGENYFVNSNQGIQSVISSARRKSKKTSGNIGILININVPSSKKKKNKKAIKVKKGKNVDLDEAQLSSSEIYDLDTSPPPGGTTERWTITPIVKTKRTYAPCKECDESSSVQLDEWKAKYVSKEQNYDPDEDASSEEEPASTRPSKPDLQPDNPRPTPPPAFDEPDTPPPQPFKPDLPPTRPNQPDLYTSPPLATNTDRTPKPFTTTKRTNYQSTKDPYERYLTSGWWDKQKSSWWDQEKLQGKNSSNRKPNSRLCILTKNSEYCIGEKDMQPKKKS